MISKTVEPVAAFDRDDDALQGGDVGYGTAAGQLSARGSQRENAIGYSLSVFG
jgi:hypothetical protein